MYYSLSLAINNNEISLKKLQKIMWLVPRWLFASDICSICWIFQIFKFKYGLIVYFFRAALFQCRLEKLPVWPVVIFYSKCSTFKGYKHLLFEVYAANGQQMFSGLQMLIFCFCLQSRGKFSQLILYWKLISKVFSSQDFCTSPPPLVSFPVHLTLHSSDKYYLRQDALNI